MSGVETEVNNGSDVLNDNLGNPAAMPYSPSDPSLNDTTVPLVQNLSPRSVDMPPVSSSLKVTEPFPMSAMSTFLDAVLLNNSLLQSQNESVKEQNALLREQNELLKDKSCSKCTKSVEG